MMDELELQLNALQKYDFIDFGSGIGGSLDYCGKRFGGVGLGIDNDPKKVLSARSRGKNVWLSDISTLPREKIVSYVTMMDFLEHLPSEEAAVEMIGIACAIASDYVFIAHPSFEDEQYLRSIGLKQYWQDWHGHPTHLLISEIVTALRLNGAIAVEIDFVEGITDSSSETILPESAPTDSSKYDLNLHGPKELVEFDRAIYRQIQILGRMK